MWHVRRNLNYYFRETSSGATISSKNAGSRIVGLRAQPALGSFAVLRRQIV
jgi:hypothetical protein